ncbi:MAG: ATP-binding cassette domain-containing protein [Bacillota bacterium]
MIDFEGVTKQYNTLPAVNNFSLSIAKKEIFGLLGPNGAGKTTLIRMLTALTRPNSGRVLVQGRDMTREPVIVKGQIGVVLQHINLDGELTVWENLELHGRLHKVAPRERRERIAELPSISWSRG